jgi:RNA polymerase sigma-70 factor (ECF subfamily)
VPTAGARSEVAEDLVAICADEVVFRAWYDAAMPRVYAYLFARTGGDRALAEDLTQQTFLRAIRARASYDGHGPIIAWMCGIARHLLTDHHRRLDREERSLLRVVVRDVEPDGAERLAERDAVLATLRRLPALQRAALALRYLDGMSVRQVAAAIGKSEKATESLLSRGRERFRHDYDGVVR